MAKLLSNPDADISEDVAKIDQAAGDGLEGDPNGQAAGDRHVRGAYDARCTEPIVSACGGTAPAGHNHARGNDLVGPGEEDEVVAVAVWPPQPPAAATTTSSSSSASASSASASAVTSTSTSTSTNTTGGKGRARRALASLQSLINLRRSSQSRLASKPSCGREEDIETAATDDSCRRADEYYFEQGLLSERKARAKDKRPKSVKLRPRPPRRLASATDPELAWDEDIV